MFIPSENTKTTLIDALLRVAGKMFLLSSTDRGTASAGFQQVLPNVCGVGKGVGVREAWADTLRASCDLRNDWYHFPGLLPACGD